MKWLKIIGISIGILVVAAVIATAVFIKTLPTSVKHLPYIELRNPVLVTPRGPIPLVLRGDMFFNRGGRTTITVEMDRANLADELLPLKFRLMVGMFGGPYGTIQLFDFSPEADSAHVSFPEEALYQKNNGQKIRISIQQERNIKFDMPSPLNQYDMTVYDGTMSAANASRVKAGETDVHYFSIPLVVGSERHEIQLRFRLGVETKEVITSVMFGGMGP